MNVFVGALILWGAFILTMVLLSNSAHSEVIIVCTPDKGCEPIIVIDRSK